MQWGGRVSLESRMAAFKIVVTGGYGSGKSTVCRIMHNLLDCHFVSADSICKEQMNVGAQGWQRLKESWDEKYFFETGELNRSLVRETIFADSDMKCELENILHPLVRDGVEDAATFAFTSGKKLLVEIPLFFESNQQTTTFDSVVTVAVADEIAVNRAIERDRISRELAYSIITSQLAIEEKKKRADFVINNEGLLVATFSQISRYKYSLPC